MPQLPPQPQKTFLSTLSLRRATSISKFIIHPTRNFYPRSPCGERRVFLHLLFLACYISIHALLAESDFKHLENRAQDLAFLSTLSLRRATIFHVRSFTSKDISIHALLAESDDMKVRMVRTRINFYPRSPCGERPDIIGHTCNISAFLSTLSLRRATILTITICIALKFLSTLSLRRATRRHNKHLISQAISIHALLAESDGPG